MSIRSISACLLSVCVVLGGCGLFRQGQEEQPPPPAPLQHDLEFYSQTLPLAIVGHAYSQSVQPSSGNQPYGWVVAADHLPPGVTAQSASDRLTFSGTPTAAGDYEIPVTVTDALEDTVGAVVTAHVAAGLDVNGTWSFQITVTQATGPCEGEAGDSNTDPIEVAATPTGVAGNFTVVLSGWLGDPSNRLSGTITNWTTLHVSGAYPEDGGTTATSHDLVIHSLNEMSGIESWSWSGGGQTCANGKAAITATR